MKITSILIFSFVLSTFPASAQDETDSKSKHNYYLGVNLLTPFGSYKTDHTFYPLSFVSSNLNVSFYGEYRYANFGIKVPVRIPIKHIDLDEINASASDGFYFNIAHSFLYDTQFEVGLKPVAYLNPANDIAQVFVGGAIYFGEHRAMNEVVNTYYTIDNDGYYTNFDYNEVNYTQDDNATYTRLGGTAGLLLQFENGLCFTADLDLFYGQRYSGSGNIHYSNYNTTDGELEVVSSYNSYRRTIFGVQAGLHVGYRF